MIDGALAELAPYRERVAALVNKSAAALEAVKVRETERDFGWSKALAATGIRTLFFSLPLPLFVLRNYLSFLPFILFNCIINHSNRWQIKSLQASGRVEQAPASVKR